MVCCWLLVLTSSNKMAMFQCVDVVAISVIIINSLIINGSVVNTCTVYSQNQYRNTTCLCADDAVYLSSPGEEHLRIIRIDKLWMNPKYDF